MLALAEADKVSGLNVAGISTALEKAGSFMQAQNIDDNIYASVLRHYALLSAKVVTGAEVKDSILALSKASGKTIYWPGPREREIQNYHGTHGISVELTGYGLMILTKANELSKAFQGARWLLEKRSAGGGFVSTQDTIVALEALATYASVVSGSSDITVSFNGAGLQESASIDQNNFDVLQTFTATPGEGIAMTAKGKGMALVSLELRFNEPERRVEPCYSVDANWFITDPDSMVEVCAKPKPECMTTKASGMAIISVGLFTGYSASTQSLAKAKSGGQIKRYELNDRRVDLYLEEISPLTECIRFDVLKAYNVQGYQAARTEVYEYYTPERRGAVLTAHASVKDVLPDPLPSKNPTTTTESTTNPTTTTESTTESTTNPTTTTESTTESTTNPTTTTESTTNPTTTTDSTSRLTHRESSLSNRLTFESSFIVAVLLALH